MIEQLLPASVVVVEARDDGAGATLFAEEQALLAAAIEKRRREFATGRVCARAALARLGYPAAPILRGSRGEPLWPRGVVGAITHCDGYRAAALASSSEIATIGIDAEPHAQLPDSVCRQVALPDERAQLRGLHSERPRVHWDRLLFSAKECVYKAWFPLAKRWLGCQDVSIEIDPRAGIFAAQILAAPTPGDGLPRGFCGRWRVVEGLVLTAIATPRAPAVEN